MTDTLEVFGVEYTGVTGIKATDDNGQIKTYIRPQGTKSITQNGTGIDVTSYASVDVSVSGGSPTLQIKSKTYTPSTTQQTETVTADSGYDGLDEVNIIVNAIPSQYIIPSGSKNISSNGTHDVTSYASAVVNVTPSLQSKSATPTESAQTIAPDTGYDGLSQVTVGAISSTYVGSQVPRLTNNDIVVDPADNSVYIGEGYIDVAGIGSSMPLASNITASASINSSGDITTNVNIGTGGYIASGTYPITDTGAVTPRSSTDLTVSGATVTAPGGYYSSSASKSVASGTAGTPTATKGSVSNHSVSVTPSVTNTTGYITGSTKTGTAVTVSANELVSGSETKTANGTYDVTNLATLVVNLSFSTIYTGSSNPSSSMGSNGDIYLKVVN